MRDKKRQKEAHGGSSKHVRQRLTRESAAARHAFMRIKRPSQGHKKKNEKKQQQQQQEQKGKKERTSADRQAAAAADDHSRQEDARNACCSQEGAHTHSVLGIRVWLLNSFPISLSLAHLVGPLLRQMPFARLDACGSRGQFAAEQSTAGVQ